MAEKKLKQEGNELVSNTNQLKNEMKMIITKEMNNKKHAKPS